MNQMAKKAEPAVLKAVQRGDLEALRRAFDEGLDPEACDRHGASLLQLAAGAGQLEALALLLEKGASVDKSDDAGNTPLMLASARGQLEAVKRLLAAGADPAQANRWGLAARDWSKWPSNGDEIEALLLADRNA
jgi:ankyrin repeat protein